MCLLTRAPHNWDESSSLQPSPRGAAAALPEKLDVAISNPSAQNTKEESEDESYRKKRRREEKKHERREKRHSRDADSDERRRKHRKDKRRHGSE